MIDIWKINPRAIWVGQLKCIHLWLDGDHENQNMAESTEQERVYNRLLLVVDTRNKSMWLKNTK